MAHKTNKRIYLDWAATAPPTREALEKLMSTALENFGNPSSPHPEGFKAERLLDRERQNLADCLGCRKEEVIFTSSGTESNNLILNAILPYGFNHHGKPPRVVLSGIEHPSLYLPAKNLESLGFKVKFVQAGRDGIINPESIEKALDIDTRLVSVMLVNNETGAIQPVGKTAERVKKFAEKSGRRIHFHTDAVQGFEKIPFHPSDMDIDSATISAHKLSGPRGVGALFLRKDCPLTPIYRGGEQEMGFRPGTENLPAIAGFALAAQRARASMDKNFAGAQKLLSFLIEGLNRIDGAVVIPLHRLTAPELYSPYILAVAFPPVPGEVLVRVLGERGICVSTGSACASRKKDRDRVLSHMGISREVAFSTIRISTGPSTTREEAAGLLESLAAEVPGLLKIAR
jgi:cysteine desulfurase